MAEDHYGKLDEPGGMDTDREAGYSLKALKGGRMKKVMEDMHKGKDMKDCTVGMDMEQVDIDLEVEEGIEKEAGEGKGKNSGMGMGMGIVKNHYYPLHNSGS